MRVSRYGAGTDKLQRGTREDAGRDRPHLSDPRTEKPDVRPD